MFASTLKRSTTALLVALCLTGAAMAQQAAAPISASHKAAALEFLTASGGGNTFDGVVGQIVDEAKVLLLQTNPDLGKSLTESADVAKKALAGKTEEMLDAVASGFAGRFSEAELKELIAFFKSPVGKKFVSDQPLAMQEGFVNVQALASKVQAEALDTIRTEMAKKGHKL